MAIAYVQSVGTATASTSGTTIAVTVPVAGVAAGDTLVLSVGFSGATGLGNATAADNHAGSTNTYTNQVQVDDTSSTGCYSAIITCPVTTALVSGDVITVTCPTTVTYRTLFIDEFSGVASSSPVDTTGTGNAGASGTTTSSASVTTTFPNDLIVGVTNEVNKNTLTWTDTSSPGTWTSSQITTSSTGRRSIRDYQIVSATNTYTVSGTLSTAELWSVAIVALKAAGPKFIGQNSQNLFTTASFTIPTTDITWGTPVAGNALILSLTGNTSGATSVTSSDGTWTKLGSTTASDGYLNEVWICPNIAGGKNAISVHLGSSGNCETWLSEFSGLDTSGTLDGTIVTNSGTGTSVSASITTADTGDLLIFSTTYEDNSANDFNSTNPTGWTLTNVDNQFSWGLGCLLAHEENVAAGTYSPSYNLHASTTWNALLIAIKAKSSTTTYNKTLTFSAAVSPSLPRKTNRTVSSTAAAVVTMLHQARLLKVLATATAAATATSIRASVFGKSLSTAVAGTASLPRQTRRAVVASAHGTATVGRHVSRTISASAASVASLPRRTLRSLSVSAAARVVLPRHINRTLSAAAGLLASIVHTFQSGGGTVYTKTLTAAAGASALVQRMTSRSVVVSTAATAHLTRGIAKSVQASAAGQASVRRGINRTLLAQAAASVSLRRGIAKTLSASVGLLASILHAASNAFQNVYPFSTDPSLDDYGAGSEGTVETDPKSSGFDRSGGSFSA